MIKPSTMKALLDDAGYTACKVQTEDEYIKNEMKTKEMYSFMLGIRPQNLSKRKNRERMIVELNGRTLLLAVEAELNIGE